MRGGMHSHGEGEGGKESDSEDRGGQGERYSDGGDVMQSGEWSGRRRKRAGGGSERNGRDDSASRLAEQCQCQQPPGLLG